VIFLQFSAFSARSGSQVQNFLVEGTFKSVPQDLMARASLVIDTVNQVDVFKSRSPLTVAQDMASLTKLVNDFYGT